MKFLILILLPILALAQPNCNAFLYKGDTLQYKACKLTEEVRFSQFDNRFHDKFDEALKICPYYAYAYREKSTAYLKSGDFINWKILIDQAVKYDTLGNLGYRGWCRFQFFRDYQGAINDIEQLEKQFPYDMGYGANGHFHLSITKAMCYSMLGNKQKAIAIIQKQLQVKNYEAGLYDYFQLGANYFALKDYKNALKYFELQSIKYEIADNLLYKAKIYKILNDKIACENSKIKALQLYNEGKKMVDDYTVYPNKIYLEDITNE